MVNAVAPEAKTEPSAQAAPAAAAVAAETKSANATATTAPVVEPAKVVEVAAKAAAAAQVADIKLVRPDAHALDAAQFDQVAAFAKEHGLSQAQAEKLIERDAVSAVAGKEAFAAQFDAALIERTNGNVTTWAAESLADKDLGGGDQTKLVQSVEQATKGLKAVDPTGEVAALLNSSGLGSHPVALRLFKRIAAMNAEDSVRPANGGDVGELSAAQLLYGSSRKT